MRNAQENLLTIISKFFNSNEMAREGRVEGREDEERFERGQKGMIERCVGMRRRKGE